MVSEPPKLPLIRELDSEWPSCNEKFLNSGGSRASFFRTLTLIDESATKPRLYTMETSLSERWLEEPEMSRKPDEPAVPDSESPP